MTESVKQGKLITPFGGKLVDLVKSGEEREKLLKESAQMPSLQIFQS